MKLRHAGALALVGWYLMAPPNKQDNAPLSSWIVWNSYDSAQACESARTKSRDDSVATLKKYHNMTEPQRRDLLKDKKAFAQEMTDTDSFAAALSILKIPSEPEFERVRESAWN